MTDPAAMGWLALVAEAAQLEKLLARLKGPSAPVLKVRLEARRELVRDEIQKRMGRAA